MGYTGSRPLSEHAPQFSSKHLSECSTTEDSVEQVFERLQRLRRSQQLNGLTVLVEPSDNIGGGAPGNGTELLQALVENEFDNAAICLWAPQVVSRLSDHCGGDIVPLELGCSQGLISQPAMRIDCKLGIAFAAQCFAYGNPKLQEWESSLECWSQSCLVGRLLFWCWH
jgi:microcystin degradation protein MlrC